MSFTCLQYKFTLNIFVVSSISTSIANSVNFAKSVESKNNYVNSTVNNNYSGYKNNNQNIQSNNNSSHNHQETFTNFVSNKQLQQSHVLRNPSIMPKNEPVKLVYPNNNNNNTQSTIVTMNNNNRVTFSTAPMNGSITLSPMTTNQQGQTLQGTNIKIAQTSQSSNVAPTLIFKNTISSTQGGTTNMTNSPVTMSRTNNQVNTTAMNSQIYSTCLLNIFVYLFSTRKTRLAAMTIYYLVVHFPPH